MPLTVVSLCKIFIYEVPNGAVKLGVRSDRDTIWLNQRQMADLFSTERSVITKNPCNMFRSGKLDRKSVCASFAHAASDGNTYQVQYTASMPSFLSVTGSTRGVAGSTESGRQKFSAATSLSACRA